MRYLDEQTQSELLNMNEVIEEVGQALKAFSEGKTETHCDMCCHLINTSILSDASIIR